MINHGGKRASSGRGKTTPLLKRTTRNLVLPEWMWQEIDKLEGSRTASIEPALMYYYGLTPPVRP